MFGTGKMTENILNLIGEIPKSIELLGFIDNDSRKWKASREGGKTPVYPPTELNNYDFDKLIIMSDIYFDTIKNDMIYWHHISPNKIGDLRYLLKILMMEKFKSTSDLDICEIMRYWQKNDISVYNQYVKKGIERYTVQWDYIENMPYIMFEDKRMYFPYDYKFQEYDGEKVVMDILAEQQDTSPHRYIKDDIKIEEGDVIVDAGVQEGNFSLRYIEKVSKAYLFESDKRWIKPLEQTFKKFKDKVILCNKFLGQFSSNGRINLDTIVEKRLDFLKMDIEGEETAALLGGRETLLNNDVKCAISSYHKNGDEVAIKDILDYYGYKTNTSKGYMVFYYDENIYSTLDFRRGIVYARKA